MCLQHTPRERLALSLPKPRFKSIRNHRSLRRRLRIHQINLSCQISSPGMCSRKLWSSMICVLRLSCVSKENERYGESGIDREAARGLFKSGGAPKPEKEGNSHRKEELDWFPFNSCTPCAGVSHITLSHSSLPLIERRRTLEPQELHLLPDSFRMLLTGGQRSGARQRALRVVDVELQSSSTEEIYYLA